MGFAVVVLLAYMLIILVPATSEGALAPPTMNVEVPETVVTSENFTCTINFNGTYDIWGYYAYLIGENMVNASSSGEYRDESANRTYTLTFRAPDTPQTITIYIEGYGIIGNETIKVIKKINIDVVKGIKISVLITNNTDVSIFNVKMDYYLDGKYIGETTVRQLNSKANVTVDYYYATEGLPEGKHTIKIEANNSAIAFYSNGTTASGDNNIYITIYYGEPPNYSWAIYLIIIALSGSAMLITYMNKNKRVEKYKPKWKK